MSDLSPYNSRPWYSKNSGNTKLSNDEKCQQIDKHSEFSESEMKCVCKMNKDTKERPAQVEDPDTGVMMCPEPFVNFKSNSIINNYLLYFLLSVLVLSVSANVFNVNVKKILKC